MWSSAHGERTGHVHTYHMVSSQTHSFLYNVMPLIMGTKRYTFYHQKEIKQYSMYNRSGDHAETFAETIFNRSVKTRFGSTPHAGAEYDAVYIELFYICELNRSIKYGFL